MDTRLASMFGPDAETGMDIVPFAGPPDWFDAGFESRRVHYLRDSIRSMITNTVGRRVRDLDIRRIHGDDPRGIGTQYHTMTVTSDGTTSECSVTHLDRTSPLMRLTDRTIEVVLYDGDRYPASHAPFPDCVLAPRERRAIVSSMSAPIIRMCVNGARNAGGIDYNNVDGRFGFNIIRDVDFEEPSEFTTMPHILTNNHSIVSRLDRGVRDAFIGFWEDPRTAHIRGVADNTVMVAPIITSDPRAYRAMVAEGVDDLMPPPEAYPAALDTEADRAERPWMYEK